MKQGFLAVLLASMVLGPVSSSSELQASAQQSAVPDAPAPQAPSPNVPSAPTPQAPPSNDSISGLASQAAHGKAAPDDTPAAPAADTAPASTGASADGPPQQEPPYVPKTPEEAEQFVIRQNVNYVQIPVTVLSKGQQVAGIPSRDFRIYENGARQHISFFSVDAVPLSVAFVIDQSLTRDVMSRVNNSLSAITGAFTPQDEVAVFTYADGVNQQTTFTAATGDRLPAILVRSKSKGEEMGTPDLAAR